MLHRLCYDAIVKTLHWSLFSSLSIRKHYAKPNDGILQHIGPTLFKIVIVIKGGAMTKKLSQIKY